MLKRVSIQNFKSLKDVTLDLQKVNLLIGPNNSGKTNFLKALEVANNLNKNVYYVGRDVCYLKHNTNSPTFYYVFDDTLPWAVSGDYNHYRIAENDENKDYPVDDITLKVGQGSNRELIELPDDFKENPVSYNKDVFLHNLQYNLINVRIYKPDPNKLTKPGPVGTGEEILNADCSNLVGFLDLMLGKYRRPVFNRTEKDISTCIPEFDEINLEDATPTTDLKKIYGDKSFKRIGLTNSKQGVTYWADELSEGTLYFLALLCIINQPNPPKILLLEEPEKGIHPRRIFEVIQFILRLVEEKDVQVIMTTHSPIVVDMFKDMPESVFIFDKDEEGATHVKNLQRDVIEPETAKSKELGVEPPHYTDSLGDAWTVGFLGGVPK